MSNQARKTWLKQAILAEIRASRLHVAEAIKLSDVRTSGNGRYVLPASLRQDIQRLDVRMGNMMQNLTDTGPDVTPSVKEAIAAHRAARKTKNRRV